jgi:hypothetical protein
MCKLLPTAQLLLLLGCLSCTSWLSLHMISCTAHGCSHTCSQSLRASLAPAPPSLGHQHLLTAKLRAAPPAAAGSLGPSTPICLAPSSRLG